MFHCCKIVYLQDSRHWLRMELKIRKGMIDFVIPLLDGIFKNHPISKGLKSIRYLLSHASSLHDRDSVPSPMQNWPILFGGGLSQARVLDCVPSPQVKEQELHDSQEPQTPSPAKRFTYNLYNHNSLQVTVLTRS